MIIQAGDDPLKGQITLSQWEADSRSSCALPTGVPLRRDRGRAGRAARQWHPMSTEIPLYVGALRQGKRGGESILHRDRGVRQPGPL